ncbi:DUF1737 domain-containing protein [Flavisolibacter tropicus]|uniref:DUF1737 domain-containing protein n=1 Tax=Flavisolibacter tropicus TaxID=1492898 RepID=A0A172TX55_9BACT|nr:DUF1737 domain-containing protein [Flavisolibacter tropicus]ANE51562.1 hypothetical protein SY85_14670 [Flavisolibacter tropicus]
MAAALNFRVVESFDSQEFSTTIEKLLEEGWLLHGPMTAFPNEVEDGKVATVRYVQALIKDATPKRKTGFSTSMPQL